MALKYTLEDAINAWRRSSRIISYTSARIIPTQQGIINVTTTASQRNLAKEESVKFSTQFVVNKNDMGILSWTHASDISTEKLKAYGKLSDITAILREIPDSKCAEKKTCLEIWKDGCLYSSIDLAQLDKHGKVYTDGTFGALEFSPDDKHLVYLAEKKEPKKQSFLKFGVSPSSSEAAVKVGEEYNYVEDWGEQLVGKSQPVICIYDVEWEPLFQSASPLQLLDTSDEWSPGQVTWVSNEELAGVAWYHHPRRLGLIYCSSRPSRIFKCNISSEKFEWFGPDSDAVASPRFHSGSGNLIHLKSKAYGPHHKEQKIVVIDREGKRRQVEPPTDHSYRGMYNLAFPDRCWSPDGQTIVFSTPCKSSLQSYALSLDTGEIVKLSVPEGHCTGSVVLDVYEDLILASGVCLTRPDQLFIGRIDFGKLGDGSVSWKALTKSMNLSSSLASDVLNFQISEDEEYDALLVFPSSPSKNTPLIVAPHGGPHSVSTDQFKTEAYFFAQLGYAVLLVNFRGSTGFGEKALHSLLGKIGTQDVQDVHNATLKTLEKHSFLDKELVFLFGGSHGGFLVTHLSGQYPDFYRAVSTRNPVTDLTTMFPISDIADWTIVEANLGDGRDLERIISSETYRKMLELSPIKYVSKVKAATLLLVGKVDRRVPPSQSFEYYRALQLYGTKTKMLVYEDCHSLSQVPVDTDALINTALWFKEAVQ